MSMSLPKWVIGDGLVAAFLGKLVFTDADLKSALKDFTVIKLQAEDICELRKLRGFEDVIGLPAFVIYP